MSELNLGANWGQSKELVKFWHNKWAKAELENKFIMAYYNPADTSFKEMVHNFASLSDSDKKEFIALAESMRALKD